jgi:hypothetical protein
LTAEGFKAADQVAAAHPIHTVREMAIFILRIAVASPTRHVHLVPCDGVYLIKAGDRDFGSPADPKDAADWKTAFDQLLDRGFIRHVSDDSLYEVTPEGVEGLTFVK